MDFLNNTVTVKHTVVCGTKTIHIKDRTKNDSSTAALPLPDPIKRRLLEWKCQQDENRRLQPNDYVDSDYIFTQANGELLRPEFITAHFRILLKKIGMPPIRFHDLRHSAACYLFSLGYSLKDVQTWLRHKDIQTTANMYIHIDMTTKSGIAENLAQGIKI